MRRLALAALALLLLAPSAFAQRGRASFRTSFRGAARPAFQPISFSQQGFRRAGEPAGPAPQAGAWVRTAGMGSTVSPGGGHGSHAVEGGSHFMNTTAGYRGEVLTGAGMSWGRPDTQPSSGRSGNGISIRNDTTIPGQ